MNDPQDRKGISPVAAGIAGLIIGVLGTTVVALSDHETRKKAAKKAKQLQHDLKKWSNQTLTDFRHFSDDMKQSVEKGKDDSDEVVEEKILRN